ncbi:MAG: hypothetical protein QOG87_2829 [Actinomycetota bacterium]|jgi:hypothetical protein
MRNLTKSPLYTAVALVGLGFVLIFFGWNGAAGKDYTQGQIPYLISGGVAGLALVLCGLAVVIVQAVRRESVLLAAKLDRLADALGAPADATGDLPALSTGDDEYAPLRRESVSS